MAQHPVVVALAERDGHLGFRATNEIAFILPQEGLPMVFVPTYTHGTIRLEEQGGEQRSLASAGANHGVRFVANPAQWHVIEKDDGTVLLQCAVPNNNYLACNENGTIVCTNVVERAARLFIRQHDVTPAWVLRRRDAVEEHMTAVLREQLAMAKATVDAQAQQIQILRTDVSEVLLMLEPRAFCRHLFEIGCVTANCHDNPGIDGSVRHGYLYNNTTGAQSYVGLRGCTLVVTIDLQTRKKIVGFKTQGRPTGTRDEYVKRYKLEYSDFMPQNGASFDGRFRAHDGGLEFAGNSDRHSVVAHYLGGQNVRARFVRVVIEPNWHAWLPAIRFDVVFCD